MLLHLPLALALLAPSPAPAATQARDSCPPPTAPNTVSAAVVATLEPLDPADSLPPGYARQFLIEVARRLALPDPLPLVPYRRVGPRAPLPPGTARRIRDGGAVPATPRAESQGEQAFRLLLSIRLGDGDDAQVSLAAGSLTPAADSAALAAVQRLIADGLVTSVRGRTIDTRLLLHTVDSAKAGDVVLFRYRTPRVPFVEASVQWAPAPRYPVALRDRRQSGEARAEFVVWTDGRVDPGSISIRSATHRDFAVAVLTALPAYRFLPATVAGCPVPQLVEMPFVFSIR